MEEKTARVLYLPNSKMHKRLTKERKKFIQIQLF